jgi:hypothetical protein
VSEPSGLDVSSHWFDPLRVAMARVRIDPVPDAIALQAALGDRIAPFVFEVQRGKRGRRAVDAEAIYEVRIARRQRIPTRAHVHDLMNALVWATFPESKRVIAERQHAALIAQVGERPTALPNARTRERDVLAMIDEGGVVITEGGAVVIGHAIYEHLATKGTPVRGFPIRPTSPSDTLDGALADTLRTFDASSASPMAVRIARTSASIDTD